MLFIGTSVSMSSQEGDQAGERLVDGIYDTSKVAGTTEENFPWMQIDLGQTRCIDNIRTYRSSASMLCFIIII